MGRHTLEFRRLHEHRGSRPKSPRNVEDQCMEARRDEREESKGARDKQRQRQREVMASKINAGWHQTPANQFALYLKQNQVLEQLEPALPLLFEMPVKPTDLYEFLGEFLDDGGQTLMKISLLQAELLFKQTEVDNLRSDPEYLKWKDRLDFYIQDQGQAAMRASFLSQAGDPFPSDISGERPSIAESARSSFGRGLSFSWIPGEQTAKPPPGIFPIRTSFIVQASYGPSRTGSQVSLINEPGFPSQEARPSLLIARESFQSGFGWDDSRPPEFMTLEDVKAIPFKERLSIFADAEESGLNIICTPSQTMLRIDQEYAEEEDRLQLEEIVGFIEDHKKVDPIGILFDFNMHNRDQEYVNLLAARPSQLAEQQELIRQNRLKKLKVDPMKGTDFHEEDEGSDYSESELATAKYDPFREASILKDGFHVMAEMRQFEAEALMEQERFGRIHSDNSSDESEVDPDREADESSELMLREFTELEAKSPQKTNRFLRVLKAPKLKIADCIEWSGNHVKTELKQVAKKLPRMIKGLKLAYHTRPIPPPLEDRRLFQINQEKNPEDAERRLGAINEANKYNLALKGESLHILLHLKTNLIDSLTKAKELKAKQRHKRRCGRKNYGYTKIEVDPETKRKEKAQKLISLFSHARLENPQAVNDRKPKHKKKKRNPYYTVEPSEDPATAAPESGKGRKKTHGSKHRSRSRNRSSRSRSAETGRASRRSRSLRRAREEAEAEQINKSLCLKTASDFLFEIPLKEVKATQKWIDTTFPESVFRLNEPLPDPKLEDEFDDNDENYAWLDDYYEIPGPEAHKQRFDDDLVIPREAMQKIQDCGISQIPNTTCCSTHGNPKSKTKNGLKLISEARFGKPVAVPGVQSLTQIPNKQLYRSRDLRPSEVAKQYVIDTFAQPFQSEVLCSFNFSLLDPDFK